ncbi:MAG: hypothetical protein OCC49_09985 [Fibrobacterales bacterium]
MSDANEKLSAIETALSSATKNVDKHNEDLVTLHDKSDRNDTVLKQQGNELTTHHLKIAQNASGVAQITQELESSKSSLTETIDLLKAKITRFATIGAAGGVIAAGLILFMFIGYYSQSNALNEALENNNALLKQIEASHVQQLTAIQEQITAANTTIQGVNTSVVKNGSLVRRNAGSLKRVIRKSNELKILVSEAQPTE